MRKVILKGPRRVEVIDSPEPRIASNQILVDVKWSAVSQGSEMHLYRGIHPNLTSGKWGYWVGYPLEPGYACTGIVREVGEEAKGIDRGDLVACMAPHAEVVAVDHQWAATLPDGLDPRVGTLCTIGTTCFHAVRRASVRLGDTVAVIGGGLVGLICAVLAGQASGLTIDLFEPDPERRKLAAEMGLEVKSPHEPQANQGYSVVFECSGTGQGMQDAFTRAADQGRVVLVGYYPTPVTVSFADEAFHRELTILVSRGMGPDPRYEGPYVTHTASMGFKAVPSLLRRHERHLLSLVQRASVYSPGMADELYRKLDSRVERSTLILLDWTIK